MRIATNITAMNTYRNYSINNSNVAKAAEKLSSGYAINSASDDAAGLAITEKMKAQINGLDQASKNSQNAISLCQTAEGALSETQSMLQRMNELAVESANGTNESFDRTAISAEYDQLKTEIDQVASTTTFNNINLLDGTLGSSSTVQLNSSTYDGKVSTASSTQSFVVNSTTAQTIGGATTGAASYYTIQSTTGLTTSNAGTFTLSTGTGTTDDTFASDSTSTASSLKIAYTGNDGSTKNYYVSLDDAVSGNTYGSASQTFTLDLSAAGLGSYSIKTDSTASDNTKTNLVTALNGSKVTTDSGNLVTTGTTSTTAATTLALSATDAKAGTYNVSVSGTAVTFTNTSTGASVSATVATSGTNTIDLTKIGGGKLSYTGSSTSAANFTSLGSFTVKGADSGTNGLKIQVGANAGDQMSISINNMSTESLGIDASSISTQDGASAAITATSSAIDTVSSQRSTLGAYENRLDYKIDNLSTESDNLSSAESSIKDVDIAKEMTEYTKDNILSQASTAMLAQANSAPQNVLSLLK